MLNIRRAKPADLDELITLFAAHASFEGAEFQRSDKFKEDLASLIFEDSTILCWVAIENQRLMGYATCMEQNATWTAKKYLYMDCLYLKEDIRGQGIGRSFMNTISRELHARGLSEIQWQTPATNQEAIKFYLRLGAQEFSKSRFIWKHEN